MFASEARVAECAAAERSTRGRYANAVVQACEVGAVVERRVAVGANPSRITITRVADAYAVIDALANALITWLGFTRIDFVLAVDAIVSVRALAFVSIWTQRFKH